MELTNEFVIDRGVEETWTILNDLEFIAPCMPGAQLQEIEGDEYRGVVKVKVGPITAQYKGKASFIEQDTENRVAKLKAEGRDPRQGNANATVTATMAPAGDGQTTVSISTDLSLSGKIASFGRGAIEDVSKKILGQFIENLREKLATTGAPDTDTAADDAGGAPTATTVAESEAAPSGTDAGTGTGTAADEAGGAPTGTAVAEAAAESGESPSVTDSGAPSAPVSSATAPAAGSGSTSGGIRRIEGPEAEPVDLLAVSGQTLAKRAIPAAGGLAIVLVILYWLLGRG